MTSSLETPPRRSVPAPQLTWAQRLREVLLSPNAIRTASVAVFFVIWEYYGRRMDPIFMAPPSAIFEAALHNFISREPLATVEVAAVRDPRTLKPVDSLQGRPILVALFVRIGTTRLLDNRVICQTNDSNRKAD